MSLFVWRWIMEGLLTDERLGRSNIPQVSQCALCCVDCESFEHLFFECKVFKEVWKKFVGFFNVSLKVLTRWKWLAHGGSVILGQFTCEICGKWVYMFLVARQIWLRESTIQYLNVMCSILSDMSDITIRVPCVILSVKDWNLAARLNLKYVGCKPQVAKEVIWRFPFENWIKLNVNGCSLGNPHGVGVRGVFRNKIGALIGAFSEYLGVTTNYDVEFLVLVIVICIEKDKWYLYLWIEFDSALVVEGLQTKMIP
ncbi:hypothetical protein NE237_004495 [Protea cynaroides]|uniref:Reverse transcriptase zinc-binding domain-containing protein n=1 Tax=Protea cynaroides TaxID=273540 RepID=A0A9Q0KJ18_9MAGN|nr:hypothetical protein NE237_004495 [Protea cynaroides]